MDCDDHDVSSDDDDYDDFIAGVNGNDLAPDHPSDDKDRSVEDSEHSIGEGVDETSNNDDKLVDEDDDIDDKLVVTLAHLKILTHYLLRNSAPSD